MERLTSRGDSDVTSPSTATRREVGFAATALGVTIGLAVADAALRGALGASRNDDWAYLRVVFRFVEAGEFSLDGWTQMTFVGQALLAWPVGRVFGSSIVAMHLAVAGLAWVGSVACYLTIRTFARVEIAALAIAALVAGPIFGTLATSFMTDVPSFCFQMLVLFGATRMIRLGWSSPLFVAMCASGVVATSIREYGIVVLGVAVVLVGLYCQPAGRHQHIFVGVSLGSAIVILGLLRWRAGVPNGDPLGVPVSWVFEFDHFESGLRVAASAFMTLGLLVLPIGAVGVSRRLGRAALLAPWRTAVIVLTWVCIGALSHLRWIGNYVQPGGSYGPLVQGSTPPVLSDWVFVTMQYAAYVSLLVLLLLVGLDRLPANGARMARSRPVAWLRSLEPPAAARIVVLTVVVALGCLHLGLMLISTAPFFDRYLIPFAPFLFALAATSHPIATVPFAKRTRLLLVAACACLLPFGMAFIDAAATVDGTKWRFGERLVDAGFAPANIDAGFEWFNFNQVGLAESRPGPDRNWWTSFYASTPVCVTVVAGAEFDAALTAGLPELRARSVFGGEYLLRAVPGPSNC